MIPKWVRSAHPSACVALALSFLAAPAEAQRPKPGAKPPPAPAPSAPAVAEDARPKELVTVTAGGLTAEQAGTRARSTSFTVRAAEESRAAAAARTDRAFAGYFPRLVLLGRYTRLSTLTPPVTGEGLVVSTQPPRTVNPTNTVVSEGTAFPLFFNQWLFQAQLTVPLSDYFFTINKNHSSFVVAEEAARFDSDGARARAYSDAKVVYFNWLRSRGAFNVAQQSLAVAKAHLKDTEALFGVGSVSKSDVLRGETAVAVAELAVERARANILIYERQLRTALHAKDDEALEPGEALDGPVPALPADARTLVAEALSNRADVKSLQLSAEAARKAESAARGARYPNLSAFGDVTVANPNNRKFPLVDEFFPTWAVGAQLTWSPNDFIGNGATAHEAAARAATLEAESAARRDATAVEVITAYQAALATDVGLQTTDRQLTAASETYRVARELYVAGRGTATTLIDAETTLTQARFDHLNARVDARITRIQLDHAVGRDLKSSGQ